MKTRLFAIAVTALALGTSTVAIAGGAPTLAKRIVHAGPAGENVAAYVAIAGHHDDKLLGVSCACAERAEIHRVTRIEGRGSMDVAPSLPVPADGTLEISPGSPLHLMLIGLKVPLITGRTVDLTLRFEKAGKVTAPFSIVADSAAGWRAAAD